MNPSCNIGFDNCYYQQNITDMDISDWNTYQIEHFLDQLIRCPDLPDGTVEKLATVYPGIINKDHGEVSNVVV